MTAVPLLCLLALGAGPEEGVPLVEISSSDEGEGVTPREIAQLEDAIAMAFHSERLHVETRRQRLSRTPPQVFWQAQALQACANPRWAKARVLRCVQAITVPHPPLRAVRLTRATHQLRISRAVNAEGELIAMSLTTLGRNADDVVARRQLPPGATPTDRRATALELASEVLGPLRTP
ncbi:MAG: hypothetical protein HY904_26460 [Deltaproteobacteria bacterium]|nr:hypothetical protein [Deltaproteobacteria bacterium]